MPRPEGNKRQLRRRILRAGGPPDRLARDLKTAGCTSGCDLSKAMPGTSDGPGWIVAGLRVAPCGG